MGFEMKSRSDKPKTSKSADVKGYEERFMESRLKHIYTPEFKAFILKANQYKNSKEIYGNLFESARNSKINERNQRIKYTYGVGDPTILRVQASLVMAGYDLGNYGANGVDGDLGSLTIKAIKEFKKTVGLECNEKLDGETMYALDFVTEKGFTKSEIELIGKEVQQSFKPESVNDFSTKEGTKQAIKSECIKQGLTLPTQIAYVLATVQWETAGTFKPVREAYKETEKWRKKNYRYYPYYGRGYVQITWRGNYDKYSQKTGQDLVNNPDLALDPETALFILVDGFKTGAFTGKKITDYINSVKTDFVGARRCINGTDRDKEIAKIAETYLDLIKCGKM